MNDDYGHRLMATVLDQEALCDPDRTFALVPCGTDLSQGFRNVSFAQVANATNHAAHWLRDIANVPLDGKFETLTYVRVGDLRYNILLYAAIKCSCKVDPTTDYTLVIALTYDCSCFSYHLEILRQ
jgi:hypothetical protein